MKWIKKFYKEDSVIEVDHSINDPEFGRVASDHLYHLILNAQ
jgi:hypothetical protein